MFPAVVWTHRSFLSRDNYPVKTIQNVSIVRKHMRCHMKLSQGNLFSSILWYTAKILFELFCFRLISILIKDFFLNLLIQLQLWSQFIYCEVSLLLGKSWTTLLQVCKLKYPVEISYFAGACFIYNVWCLFFKNKGAASTS